jgi:hypothetical protein
MRRQIAGYVVLMMLIFGTSHALAHENFRVIGTLTSHRDAKIEVKSKDSKTTSIRLDKQTVITRDKKKVDSTELRIGQSLVVDGYGDSEADLLALEIRIVPPINPR